MSKGNSESAAVKLIPKIVIVGNGFSLRGSQSGSLINSFDEVVRINNFRIDGYERSVGTKTTCWATASHLQVPKVMPRGLSRLTVMPHGQTNAKFGEPSISRRVEGVPDPSTGLAVIAHFVRMQIHVSIIGVDSYFLMSPKNYWDEDDAPVVKTNHSSAKEMELISSWVRFGFVRHLEAVE